MEAPPPSAGPPFPNVAPGKRGLTRGLRGRSRTVRLMLDATIITETPPLYAWYGRRGEQVAGPLTGHHARRVLHGALNIRRGDGLLCVTATWDHATIQPSWR